MMMKQETYLVKYLIHQTSEIEMIFKWDNKIGFLEFKIFIIYYI